MNFESHQMQATRLKVSEKELYTTKFQAGLGLVAETKILLELWDDGLSRKDLYLKALNSGMFPNVTARRLLNIVSECFAHRYLAEDGRPAKNLKTLLPSLSSNEFQQFLLLYTCRANKILFDFIRNVYWEKYSAGYTEISNEDSLKFVRAAVDRGVTVKQWSESVISRVSSYLSGCCADYGLLESGRKSNRKILPFRISPKMLVYLVYELHFSGLGDNSVLEYEDWNLFGLNREDVFNEMKRASTKGYFIVQSAGDVVKIGWQYKNFAEVLDVITES